MEQINVMHETETLLQPKKGGKKGLKIVLIVLCVLLIVAGAVYGVSVYWDNQKKETRATLLEEAIQPIMTKYGLTTYKVVATETYSFEIYAEGFEELTNGQAIACLTELDAVCVDDPYNELVDVDFGMTKVHPGMDVSYGYWRVSSHTVQMNRQYGGNYTQAGLYCDRTGRNECVYACRN